MAEFPVQGTCDVCAETTVPLTKYKGLWYCKLCLQEKKEEEKDLVLRKKRDKVDNDFTKWNQ